MVIVTCLGVLLGAIYGPVLSELVAEWIENPNYSHGFLVPLFSGWLVWQQRETLRGILPRGHWSGLPVLLLGLGALVLGDLGAEYFLTRSSFIIILAGLIIFHLGSEAFRLWLFPLVFLFFMIPLPTIIFNAIAFPLQGIAAQSAAWGLDFLGVPVLRDGNVIHLSHLTLGVTEACSGIRSLISLLAVAVVWAYLALPAGWPAMLLIVSAVPITIIANSGRVLATGLIAQWFGIEYAQGFFHSFSGWVIFLFAFIGLLGMQSIISMMGRLNEVEGQ
jgi:exosortase